MGGFRRAVLLGFVLALVVAVAMLRPGSSVRRTVLTARPVAFSVQQKWVITLNDAGAGILFSSPIVANLDGRTAAVVGDEKGRVLAYHLSDGTLVPGWPYRHYAAIDSAPSVAPIGAGGRDVVFVGTGKQSNPTAGGYLAINPSGTLKWFVPEIDPPTNGSQHHGVQSGLAVGGLQGLPWAVVGGSMGQNQDAFNGPTGHVLHGFPWLQADSNLTTPAIVDVFHNGQPLIVEGGDSSPGSICGFNYVKGGHIRVLSGNGNLGSSCPNGGLLCDMQPNEIVRSSPAVGQFTTGGVTAVVAGTGNYWHGFNQNDVIAVNVATCHQLWRADLGSDTSSSPALADLFGDGRQEVIEATQNGTVWALDGANGGRVLWHTTLGGLIYGSVVTADLRHTGHQDVIATTSAGVWILDGKTGAPITTLPGSDTNAYQNTALITQDPNGTIGITVAGYNSLRQGVIRHYEIPGSNGSTVGGNGAWPMFHHDRRLRGYAGL
jgi:hypothetical protein